jgi:hypothetical protein
MKEQGRYDECQTLEIFEIYNGGHGGNFTTSLIFIFLGHTPSL